MQYDEFIKKVQGFAQLDSQQAAEQATRATLETIAERIVGDEAKDLAAQLPAQLGQYLRGHEGENGHHFPVQEFYERISQKSGLEAVAADVQAKAVFKVLSEAVSAGEFADVKINFSEDYSELFAA